MITPDLNRIRGLLEEQLGQFSRYVLIADVTDPLDPPSRNAHLYLAMPENQKAYESIGLLAEASDLFDTPRPWEGDCDETD